MAAITSTTTPATVTATADPPPSADSAAPLPDPEPPAAIDPLPETKEPVASNTVSADPSDSGVVMVDQPNASAAGTGGAGGLSPSRGAAATVSPDAVQPITEELYDPDGADPDGPSGIGAEGTMNDIVGWFVLGRAEAPILCVSS